MVYGLRYMYFAVTLYHQGHEMFVVIALNMYCIKREATLLRADKINCNGFWASLQFPVWE